MKKILFLCIYSIFLNAYSIVSIDKDYAYVQKNPEAKINSSGIIVKNFQNNKYIINNFIVVDNSSEFTKIKLLKSKNNINKFMPNIDAKAQVDDEVVFDYLSKNAILLAKNQKDYMQITSMLSSKFDFINPDLLAAYLQINKKELPSINDLEEFCSLYALNSIIFELSNKIKIIDCISLKKVDEIDFLNDYNSNISFYSNISKELKKENFNSYYEKLMQKME